MKKIQFERRLELAMERHRFFDLVRWGIAESELNAYATYENSVKNCYIFFDKHTFTQKSELFTVPQEQIDVLNSDGNTNLKQNPGY